MTFFFDEWAGRERIRNISINGVDLQVRSGSSDLDVVISSLVEDEYGHLDCPNPRIIVDAGANIGTSAISFARKYPHAKVFAIEPENGNYGLLVKNTESYGNVVPIKAAIWGAEGEKFIQNRATGAWGYTIADGVDGAESMGQATKCITMPHLMKEYGIETIDILKMDIEGGEKDVLENSSAWIDRVQVMTVELHDYICMGCDRAFYLATRSFNRFERHGEKVTAYREQ
ncbi:FkbM family methyltransferase [Pontiella desulfatans]|nr:FkbM family methyltransferase [Pontiella desulfatans]